MEKLTEKLKYVLEDCIDCISPIQQEVINKAVDRLAAYEETGLEPEEIELLAKQRDLYVDACGELPLKRIRELAQADREGRCVVLPESYYTAEAAARKASAPAEQSERGQATAWIMQRFGQMS